jgi:predicted amidohydrolase YtcJ
MKQVYYNAKVYLERDRFARAVTVEDGVIAAVGTDGEMLALAGPGARRLDCRGCTLLPGFNDAHLHFMQLGEAMYQAPIDGAASIGELVDRCRSFIDRYPHRVQNGLHASGWNQDLFTDGGRMPDRHDLDRISTALPVVLERVCGHILSANTKTLELLGLTADSPKYPDGDFLLGDDGQPNGIFTENACNYVRRILPDFTMAQRREILLQSMDYAVSHGLTGVQSNDIGTSILDGPAAMALFRDVYGKGEGKLRYRHQICFNDLEAFRREVEHPSYAWGIENSGWLTVGPLKLFKDGSLGARTALLRRDYADDPGNRGLEWIKAGDMDAYCRLAREHGIQVVTHCIGDRAVEQTVEAYEKAFENGENRLRNALIHCQITDRALLERIARDGIPVVVQPIFLDYDMHIAQARCGETLAATSYAFGSLRRLGAHVAYSTDSPVESCDPFANLCMAVTRRDSRGQPAAGYYPDECVDVAAAVDAYTLESAYVEFAETRRGRLRAGFDADFILLDRDIFTVDPMEIKSIRPLLSVVGGRIVYRAGL